MPGFENFTLSGWFILPLNAAAPAGVIPVMLSALWFLSVGTKVTVSPGAIFTSAGSNTIMPTLPLLSILTT